VNFLKQVYFLTPDNGKIIFPREGIMDLKKTFTQLVLSCLFLSSFSAYAFHAKIYHYPSKSQLKKLVDQGLTHLSIGHSPYTGVSVGYPSGVHVKTLLLYPELMVDLSIFVGAYPSDAASKDLNLLSNNTSLLIDINSCLTSLAEKNRLAAISKPANILIRCFDDNGLKKAKELIKNLNESHPHLKITLFREF
jgi:hypothetical protein